MVRKILSTFVIFGLLLNILTGCSKSVDAKAIEEKLALANKYVLDQKYDEAILTFEEIIKIDAKLIKPYVGIAHVYLLEGKPDAAETTLLNAIKVVEDKNGIQMGLGNIYIAEQKYDQAEKSFLAIIATDAKYQVAYEGLVQVYQAQKNVDRVIDILSQAIKNNPDNHKNYSLIATAYVQKGDKNKALEMVKTSLKMETVENYDVFDALGNIFGQDWGSLISEGDKLLAADSQDKVGATFKFYGLFNSGEYQKALDFYQTVQDNLKNGRIVVDVALSYYRIGDKDKAQSFINTIDLDNIKNEAHLIDLINYFKETGEKDKAIELAKKGLLFERRLGDFYLLLYQLTSDKQYLAWLQTLGSSLDKVYYSLGLEAEKQEEWDKAIDNFSKAISINPTLPEYYFERGESFMQKAWEVNTSDGDQTLIQNGLDDYLAALNKGLVNAESFESIATAYNNLHQDEKALTFIDKACSIEPSISDYLSFYSLTLNNLDRPAEALTKAMAALEKAQNNSDKSFAYQEIGQSYQSLERYEEALSNFNKALEYTDDDNDKAGLYIYNIAHIYNKLQKPELEKQALLKGRELAKQAHQIQDADEQLSQLNR